MQTGDRPALVQSEREDALVRSRRQTKIRRSEYRAAIRMGATITSRSWRAACGSLRLQSNSASAGAETYGPRLQFATMPSSAVPYGPLREHGNKRGTSNSAWLSVGAGDFPARLPPAQPRENQQVATRVVSWQPHRGDQGPVVPRACYWPDPGSYHEDAHTREMRYLPHEKSPYSVRVVHEKATGSRRWERSAALPST
jgi:hypothetical protein